MVKRENSYKDVPERTLLDLAFEGVHFARCADRKSMHHLVTCLRSRRPELYFPFFWTHADVDKLEKTFLSSISVDDVIWYICALKEILGDRYPHKLHWMERSNLYHIFGLLRLVGKTDRKAALKAIRNVFGHRVVTKPKSIIDISSYSSLAILEEREAREMKGFAEKLLENPMVLRFYGSYQIYYYGGFDNCVDGLAKYASSSKQIFIPQSILSLVAIQNDIAWRTQINTVAIIKSRLFDILQPEVKRLIELGIKFISEAV
jgi:hypothetical protein